MTIRLRQKRTARSDRPSQVPSSLGAEGVGAGEIEVMLHGRPGPQMVATILGLLLVGVIMLGIGLAGATGLVGVLIALLLCFGSIFGSQFVCTRSQRRRWRAAVGREPCSEMVVALTSSALVIWDTRSLRLGRPALVAEVDRRDVRAERWPSWAELGGGLRVAFAGGGSISFSFNSPDQHEVDRFIQGVGSPSIDP